MKVDKNQLFSTFINHFHCNGIFTLKTPSPFSTTGTCWVNLKTRSVMFFNPMPEE